MTTSLTVTGQSLFNISKFKAALGSVARPNIWRAEIKFGDGLFRTLGKSSSDVLPNFSYRCERTTIPGKTISTVDDYGGGPPLKLAQDVTYQDIDMTIICATDMQERYIFETWMNVVVLPGFYAGSGLVNYYNNYALGNTLTLYQYNELGDVILKYTLHDVYPVQISAMNLTWEENNTYQRFDVTLNYRDYTPYVPNAITSSAEEGEGATGGGDLDETGETSDGSEVEFGDSEGVYDSPRDSDGNIIFIG